MITFNYYYYYDNLENVKKLEDLKYFISFEDKGDYEYKLKDLKFFELHPETLEEEVNDEEGLFNSTGCSTVPSKDIRIQNDSSSTKEPHSEGESKNKAVYQTESSPDKKK